MVSVRNETTGWICVGYAIAIAITILYISWFQTDFRRFANTNENVYRFFYIMYFFLFFAGIGCIVGAISTLDRNLQIWNDEEHAKDILSGILFGSAIFFSLITFLYIYNYIYALQVECYDTNEWYISGNEVSIIYIPVIMLVFFYTIPGYILGGLITGDELTV